MKKLTTLLIAIIYVAFLPTETMSQQWNELDNPLDVEVNALCVYNGELYAGGTFDWDVTSQVPNFIARYDGSEWHALGQDIMDWHVLSLCVYEGKLYVGGGFNEVDGQPSKYIARWTGTAWETLDWQLDGYVHKMYVHNGFLYFTGPTYAGQTYLSEIGRFDGETVTAVGGDWFYDNIYDMKSYGDDLWVGGAFHQLGGFVADGLAIWNGQSWGTTNEGVDGSVHALCPDVANGIMYIGGSFTMVGSTSMSFITYYDVISENFFPLGAGILSTGYGRVKSMLLQNDKLYVGGDFNYVNNQPCTGFAVWDGNSWDIDNTDIGDVHTLCVYNGDIYAGGWITKGVMRWGEASGLYEGSTQENSINIFPIPANDFISVSINNTEQTALIESISILNLQGSVVSQITNISTENVDISVENLPDGIYVVELIDNKGGQHAKRLVVSR